ncbi:MAG TPA: hypothetical protein VG052_02830 [Puia sp.]|jgi:hypothetical protein|nr:hypothetical protein [Puia sp.]
MLLITLHFATYSQTIDTADYIRGVMHSSDDSLVGYFKFDHSFGQNGQSVWYKKDLESSKTKRFQSYRYNYFTSDIVYMELFGVMPYGVGEIKVMVPRVINGPVQLFYFPHSTPFAIIQPKNEPYLIKTANWKKRVSYRKFKRDMKEVLGDSSLVYKQIDLETLKYEDIPMIVQLANMNADESAIQDYIAHRKSAAGQ